MTVPDFHHNFNHFFDRLQTNRKTDDRTEQMELNPHMGVGCFHRVVPRADIGMVIADFSLRDNRILKLNTKAAMVELSYCLQGAREIQISGQQYLVAPGSYTLQFINPAEASMHFCRDKSFQMLSVAIPVSTFHHFVEEAGGSRSVDFNRIIGKKPYRMFQETIEPAATVLLKQMLQTAKGPGFRNLEMECRVLELMSLAFRSHLLEGKPSSTKLSRTDTARIKKAREIILERMIEPPSILELSRMIGLNDYKLKIGFKEMYGTTVFGYLKDQRLYKAYRLLRDGGTSVIEVSYSVGYSNPSHFAEAFRGKYGVNPGELIRRSSRSFQ
ncbi:AraC family transcriptional regulator [Paenibacillus sp. sptzw28]|uniref:helix-turn-helix transcriptional regulator n=1 Tax=Paenibacillus sp. sptzw28 TaxID=715179 RepID=UPI001C6F2728|nr:AraC family transcriptional regulator [Paenibacillus sp. sptzw28]QYR19315.1 AraC family transcriptional regulator [Paenibacillus sp. sptzw28]